MKILSWNINGIRASRILLKDLFESLDADVICIQETKVTRDQLDSSVATVNGYNSYFSFSRKRSGYSGVATFCKESVTPWRAEEGLSGLLTVSKETALGCYGNHEYYTDDELESLDAEGRTVITQHRIRCKDSEVKDLAIINVYCPRADPDREDRKLYKLRFYSLLQTRAEALLDSGKHVVILGDINSSHKQIDRCEPFEKGHHGQAGRLWMNQLVWEEGRDPDIILNEDQRRSLPGTTPGVTGGLFIDTFRHFHPDQKDAFTNWCTLTGARHTNYGRRLDYIFADVLLTQTFFSDVVIMPEIEGSDHCPVRANLNAVAIPCSKCPSLCTKYMPEFTGKQQRLSDIFSKISHKTKNPGIISNPSPGQLSTIQVKTKAVNNELYDKGDGPHKEGSKRPLSNSNGKSQPNKKMKVSQPPIKQANLMKFFGKRKPDSNSGDSISSNLPSSQEEVSLSSSLGYLSSSQGSSGSASDDTSLIQENVTKSLPTDICAENAQTLEPEGRISSIQTKSTEPVKDRSSAAQAWKTLLSGPGKAPLCKKHKEQCVLRTVKKEGPNKGKQFYVCARGEGHSSNPEARCDFFKWVHHKKPP